MRKNKSRVLLQKIEVIGNKLPHPVYIFIILTIFVVIISIFLEGHSFYIEDKKIYIKSLLTKDGITWFLENMVNNFAKFPPLATVIVMMIGISIAESSGLIEVLLKYGMVKSNKKKIVTFIVIFSGVLGNIAGSATFAIIPPIGAMIFKSMKRNPIVGIIAGFSGVAAGLSANIFITPTDVMLSSITQKAVDIVDKNISVLPTSNWYFMIASTFVLSIVGTLVLEKFIEPKLGKKYNYDIDDENVYIKREQKVGIKRVIYITFVYIIILLLLLLPNNGLLRDSVTNSIVPSPFLRGIVVILFAWFMIVGIVYGKTVGSIKSLSDLEDMMSSSVKGLSGFIILCFFAAQFVEIFSYSNIGMYLSVKGAYLLTKSGISGIILIIVFILFVTIINFFIGSSSAKWALLAPIFVPMFMNMGISPELTQASYRIADSVTNCISPLEPFMPFIIVLCKKYDKNVGIGTLIAYMIPIAITFLVTWSFLLIIWHKLGLPLGI